LLSGCDVMSKAGTTDKAPSEGGLGGVSPL